ncbi:hypothetical protein E2562_010337 [Oryza meyeriana var. granulata]|uniref:Uncharacterized protein n=1 Tax=Oryza meyeriana var. granulata TaxID=110450 RepID=A0A6G1F6H8_9ORYZ|nr:hypothetical protein E2562_010337 [Oryza meyeriana var. granulata]
MDLTVLMGIEPLRFDLRKWTADMELGIYAGPIYHTQEKGYRWRATKTGATPGGEEGASLV